MLHHGIRVLVGLFIVFGLFWVGPFDRSWAEEGGDLFGGDTDNIFFDMTLEELLEVEIDEEGFLGTGITFYGFVNTNVERVYRVPRLSANGTTQKDTDPLEWSQPSFHLYGTARLNQDIDVLFNISKTGDDALALQNGYGNMRIVGKILQVRLGKQYRRFGLFNEKLDQTPAFLGIEPPELFDKDHLMLPRTTIATVHGEKDTPFGEFSYAFTTDNSEAGTAKEVVPLGWDFRIKKEKVKAGLSGYFSSILSGKTQSTVSVGDGSPRGGVLPWMSGDKYYVLGGFVETVVDENLIVQLAYWMAEHDADRNPDDVMTLFNNAGINPAQQNRFFGGNAPVIGNVVTNVKYTVQTWYLRLGYIIPLEGQATLTPYLFLDWMKHPEVIQSKTFGGDNEAGFADDGEFYKPSIGVVYKPIPVVAIKVDASVHRQRFNGKTEDYPEARLDVSYAFK